MRKLIGKGIDILMTILCGILFVALIISWIFIPEFFTTIETNDLIMYATIIIVGFMPEKI